MNMNECKKIKILWFGTPEISANVLEMLINDGYNIVGVVAQMDKPVGRKAIIVDVPTKTIAKKYNIPVYQPEKLRNDYSFINEINPDLILTLAYGQIVPHEVLIIPKYGCINLHGSLLPKYRGAAPIQYSLLNGDKETGITLMEMVDKMDAGCIFYQSKVTIDDSDNCELLTKKLEKAAYLCVNEGLLDVINGTNKGIEQNEEEVTFTKKINEEDQKILFNNSAFSIHNKIRALNPNPGCYFQYKNVKYKISSSKLVDIKCNIGEIISYDKDGLTIGTSEKAIVFTSIQKPGKNMLNIKDFYNGNRDLFIVKDKVD